MGKQPIRQSGSQSESEFRRAAVLIPSLSIAGTQQAGGAERTAVRLANGLAAYNVRVDLVLFKSGGQLLSEVCPRVRVVALEGRNPACCLWRLRRYIQEAGPQCILAKDNRAALLALLARKLAGISCPVTVTVHATLSWRWKQYSRLKRALIPLIVRLIHLHADAVIAVSQAAAHDLASLLQVPGNKVRVIYNPVVTNDIFRLAREAPDAACIGEAGSPFVLGVGRLAREKGFDVLLRAFASVRRERDVRLIILGDGPERRNLERLAKELGISKYVLMPGFVKNPFAYMAQASLFVLSSRWEGLPTVLIEALALGTPVVSTNCPSGPSEILEGGRWGRLVPVDDPEALASAILTALDEPRNAAPEAAWKRFTVEETVRQYLSLMDEVCATVRRTDLQSRGFRSSC